MTISINSWEDGANEGKFDTLEEAKAYVLENELDVVIYDYSSLKGSGFRFNAEIDALIKAKEANPWKPLGTTKYGLK